jgi:hypothetical protein
MLKEMEDIAFVRKTPAEAALKIQSMSRGKADRKMVEEKKKDDKDTSDAAVKIQAIQRGKTARKEVDHRQRTRGICCLNCTSALSMIVLLILSIVVAVTMFVSITMGSACYELDTTLTDMVQPGGKAAIADSRARDMITDFMLCESGKSSLTEPIKTAISGTNAMIDAVESIESSLTAASLLCSLNPKVSQALAKIKETAAQSATSAIVVGEEASCVAITPHYRKTFHVGLCGHMVDGLYTLWSLGSAAGVMLFVNLFVVFSFKHLFYGAKGDNKPKRKEQQAGTSAGKNSSSTAFVGTANNQVAPALMSSAVIPAPVPAAVPAAVPADVPAAGELDCRPLHSIARGSTKSNQTSHRVEILLGRTVL